MTIGMPCMYDRFGGSCSFLSTSIFRAGSVVIPMCYRGVMEVATINKQTPVLHIVSNHFLIYTSPFTSTFPPLFCLLALAEEHTCPPPIYCTIHSIKMARRGRGPKRRALAKITDKAVPETLLRHFGRFVQHSKEVPLEGENAVVGADIAETNITMKLPMRISENSMRTLPLPRPS